MKNQRSRTALDGSSSKSPPEGCTGPLYSQDSTPEDYSVRHQPEILAALEDHSDKEMHARDDEQYKEEEFPREISTDPGDTRWDQNEFKAEELEEGHVRIKEEGIHIEIITDSYTDRTSSETRPSLLHSWRSSQQHRKSTLNPEEKRQRREEKMEMNVDPGELVDVVHSKPELWDIGSAAYSNSIKKTRTWEAVTMHFFPDFKKESNFKKQRRVKLIKTKWKSLRDRFMKDNRTLAKCKSSQGTNKYRVHPLYEEMKFLLASLDKKDTTGNIDVSEEDLEDRDANSSRVSSSVDTEATDNIVANAVSDLENEQELDLTPTLQAPFTPTFQAPFTPCTSPPCERRSKSTGGGRGKGIIAQQEDIMGLIERVRQDVIYSTKPQDDITVFLQSLDSEMRKVPIERQSLLKLEMLKLVVSFQTLHGDPCGSNAASYSPVL